MFNYEKIQELNELESSLYNYIIKNNEKVIYMRIRELANEAHVSTTTILRFCKKMGCDGFSEFKLKLKIDIEKKDIKILGDNTLMIIDFLKKAQNDNYMKKLEEISNKLDKSNTIIFVGIGFSGIIAKYAARYISAIGKKSIYIDDPFYPIYFENSENYTTVAFSVSGETPTVIDHINRLKRKGSKIISITNNESSTLAKISDLNIGYYIQNEETNEHDITSQIPAMYIIETIAKRLYKKDR